MHVKTLTQNGMEERIMSTPTPLTDISPHLDRYRGCDFATRQQELLPRKLLKMTEAIEKCGKTVSRWLNGSHPIPLHESFRVAAVTDDWRLLQSYAREAHHVLAPITIRQSLACEDELVT